MKYLKETELRQLAETGELVLRRQNGIWACDQGAVALPVYFTLVANTVRVSHNNNAWRVSFSFSDGKEFTVVSGDYYIMTDALYDIGLLVTSWLQDAYFRLNINPDVWRVVNDAIEFLTRNADNHEPLPKHLIDAVRKLEAPSTLVTLLTIQDGRNGDG